MLKSSWKACSSIHWVFLTNFSLNWTTGDTPSQRHFLSLERFSNGTHDSKMNGRPSKSRHAEVPIDAQHLPKARRHSMEAPMKVGRVNCCRGHHFYPRFLAFP
jgi:hypothetical protein